MPYVEPKAEYTRHRMDVIIVAHKTQKFKWSEFLKDKIFSYMMKWLYENKTNYVKSVMFGEE